MGFVDLHSHVLPGIDDGAKTLADSIELTALLAGLGFEIGCATPHQKSGVFVPTREAIDGAYDEVKRALALRGVPLALYLGAENFWDDLFFERVQTSAQPGYTGNRAFLFELPIRQLPPRLDETLFELRLKGRLPVMAHPERYAPLWDAREKIESLRKTCALVVDLGALEGAHGARQRVAAQWLLDENLAHAVTTDAHTPDDIKAAATGMSWIRKRLGDAALTRLLDENPRLILKGELPED